MGYFYPAVSCYKALQELNAERMVLWCKFWTIMGLFSAAMPIGDFFLFWLPLYHELKLGFAIFLWYPDLKGTEFMWKGYVGPYLARHEEAIEAGSAWLRSVCGENITRIGQLAQQKAKEALYAALNKGEAPEAAAHEPATLGAEDTAGSGLARRSSHRSEPEIHERTTPEPTTPRGLRNRAPKPLQDLIDSVWSFD